MHKESFTMLAQVVLGIVYIALASGRPSHQPDQSIPFSWGVSSDGSYYLSVQGQKWLQNAPSFVSAYRRMFSTADGSLKMTTMSGENGQDKLGYWSREVYHYQLQGTSSSVQFMFKTYNNIPNAVFFGQHFNTTLPDTSVKDADKLVTSFPSFQTKTANATNLGFLAYGGIMVGDTDKQFGVWGSDNGKIHSGLDSGPLVLFNQQSDVLIISPFYNFMAGSAVYNTDTHTASWGIMGNASMIPEDFSYWTVVYYGGNGINQAMEDWGQLMRLYYNKKPDFRNSDMTVNYLGYWTDNGAYYYYLTEEGKTYEETIFDIKKYADQQNIPYRYVQYDSWWYPKDIIGGGVIEWTSIPSVFPDGMQYIWNQTGWMASAHNRMWSPKTTYAKMNGGKYDFIVEEKHSIPIDPDFWTDLLKSSRNWGLYTYEQDWLNVEFNEMNATTSDVTLGRQWLRQMGEGSANNGLTIQYCMSPSRAALQSLEIPVVTQARASNDYQPGNPQWKIGVSSLLVHALGLAPFKDNFWSTKHQPGNVYNSSEDAPALQSLVATLSTGPVGPSDKIGYSSRDLIMRCCNAEGLILKPSKPAMAVDIQIKKAAFGGSFPGPDGELWTTYSDIAGLRFGIILAVELGDPYSLKLSDANFGKNFPESRIFSYYDATSDAARPFSDDYPVFLSNCTKDYFCLYYTTPRLQWGSKEVLIYGEMSKWVHVSPQRVSDISIDPDDVRISLQGAGEEKVMFTVVVDGKQQVFSCLLSKAGFAQISLAKGVCVQ